ncbi:glycosyltransferase family 25 protein [Acinetobacter sp. KS-LM10]|uniref:glycosyltransferase family 25 protein n=1 Tax=Acinetobacter sp. KS-LM10 TaxID=3120518 RepID=UPI0030D53616
MKNFIISLVDAADRRTHIRNEFNKSEIDFTFFDAINITQIDEVSTQLNLNLSNSDLTNGEKACLLSHVYLWNKAIEDHLEYIAIFEDDILLGEDISSFLNNNHWISEEMDIIKLEAFSPSALMILKKIPITKQRHLRKMQGIHLGAAGYILSQKSAKTLLKYIQNLDVIIPVDHILFEFFIEYSDLNIYQICPALCIQSDRLNSNPNTSVIHSQLESERRERLDYNLLNERKIKKNLVFKINREYQRLVIKLKLLFCKISFK